MILKNLSCLIVRNLHLISNLTDQILPEKPDKNEIRFDDENISCRRKQLHRSSDNSNDPDSKPRSQPQHPLRKKNNAHSTDINNDLTKSLTQKIRQNEIMPLHSSCNSPSHIPHQSNNHKKNTSRIITKPRKISRENSDDPAEKIAEHLLNTIENPLEHYRQLCHSYYNKLLNDRNNSIPNRNRHSTKQKKRTRH